MSKAKATKSKKQHFPHKLWQKVLLGIIGTIGVLIIIVIIAFRVSPWPGALLIRYFFEKGGRETSAALEKHVPPHVASLTDIQYLPHDKKAKLDVFFPESIVSTSKVLPTIIWVHGGAWVSGDKSDVANYLKILASHNYTVVGIDYSIAPEKRYPTPLIETDAAVRFVQQHAQSLHIDKNQIVLAGDSAGSQIAAQVATIISNPEYAKEVSMTAPLQASQLKAVVLNCGAYDLALPHYNGPDGKFLKTVLWAYSGTKNFLAEPNMQKASVVDYVTKDFPPAFITAGNVDPLETQSREFAGKLAKLGVTTDTLFYDKNHQPELQHEYQFNLDQADGQQALSHILRFLDTHTTRP